MAAAKRRNCACWTRQRSSVRGSSHRHFRAISPDHEAPGLVAAISRLGGAEYIDRGARLQIGGLARRESDNRRRLVDDHGLFAAFIGESQFWTGDGIDHR